MSWAAGQIDQALCHGSLTVAGKSLNTKGWASLNNFVMHTAPLKRGENLLIGGRTGRLAMPKRNDESIRTLEILVIGSCNSAGTPYANKVHGMWTNYYELYNAVFNLTGTSHSASLTVPGGATRTGTVQIGDSELQETETESALLVTLDLILPTGAL